MLQIPTAGDTLTSSPQQSEEEKQTRGEELEGEKKEDLPDQPPPVEEKPREGRKEWLQVLSLVVQPVPTEAQREGQVGVDAYYCVWC